MRVRASGKLRRSPWAAAQACVGRTEVSAAGPQRRQQRQQSARGRMPATPSCGFLPSKAAAPPPPPRMRLQGLLLPDPRDVPPAMAFFPLASQASRWGVCVTRLRGGGSRQQAAAQGRRQQAARSSAGALDGSARAAAATLAAARAFDGQLSFSLLQCTFQKANLPPTPTPTPTHPPLPAPLPCSRCRPSSPSRCPPTAGTPPAPASPQSPRLARRCGAPLMIWTL